MPAISSLSSPVPAGAASLGASPPVGTATPASTTPSLLGKPTTGTAGTTLNVTPEIRQVLTQILTMLQSLLSSMGGGAASTGGAASGLGGAGTAGLLCPPCPPGLLPGSVPVATPASAVPVAAAQPTLIPAPAAPVAQQPAVPSFFTPMSTPTAPLTNPAAPIAPIASPVIAAPVATAAPVVQPKIPLTDGAELQQRIQNFNRTPGATPQGLVQFLNNSYSNTAFAAQPDGNLFYSVSGKNFLINASGLTPRVALN